MEYSADLLIKADCPAGDNWEGEWYPLGNGFMGAMLDGGIETSRIQFNADSLWTGDENYDGTTSDDRADQNYRTMGDYQNFGQLSVKVEGLENPEGYHRSLNISRAVYEDGFSCGNQMIARKSFVSVTDQVMVYSLCASLPVSGSIGLAGAHGEQTSATVSAGQTVLSFSGTLPNALNYVAKVRLLALDGGKLSAVGNQVQFRDCRQLLVLLVAETDFDQGRKGFRDQGKLQGVDVRLSAAASKGLPALEMSHVKAYKQFFDRLSIGLDGCDLERRRMSTAARIQRCRQGERDPELELLLYQFGRYLLISSSWPGSLPANLQGIWNNSNAPAWHADYHTNINIQMNYWGVDVANLSEMHRPLFEWMTSLLPGATAETASAFPGSKGYAYRTSTNIFGGMGWRWNLPGAAWLAHHVYEHYAFTGDVDYLRRVGWPLLKGAAEFCLFNLKTRDDGSMVVPDGWSPEHGPREDGVTHDQQIVSQLFADVLELQKVLENPADEPFFRKVAQVKPRLLGNKIGKWGQLQEWETDRDVQGDEHRHTSHLFAVYPGSEISCEKTPDLAKAARVSLEGRALTGDSRRSWTWPWRAAMWARLHDGKMAGLMVRSILQYNTMTNLFTTHPPFQIDGNLGMVGAISEALLQSHSGCIELLPVVMPGWESGWVRGIRARGGVTVDFFWNDGKVTEASLRSSCNQTVTVKINGKSLNLTLQGGKAELIHE